MFALRRAATRAAAQPLRQLNAVRPATGFSIAQKAPAQPTATFQRSFHQSWIRRAEEEKVAATEENVEATEDNAATPAAPTADAQSARQGENVSNIVYVGNLNFGVTAAELETEFAQYGSIASARVPQDPLGRSKGFGFVEFSDAASAKKAVEIANQMDLQGRRMLVMPRLVRERPATQGTFAAKNPVSRTLFIGNMSFQMSDKDLSDLFRDIENVLDVRIAIDRRSNQPRGFAHADFTDEESAVRAKAILEKKTVYGRQLRIDFGRAPTAGSRGDDGPRGARGPRGF